MSKPRDDREHEAAPRPDSSGDDGDENEISPTAPLTGRDALRADLLEPTDGRPVNDPPYEE